MALRVKMRCEGADTLIAQLRYLAEKIPDTARKQMHRAADKIVEEAKLNAPVAKHNLEQSIRAVVGRDGRRLKIDIVMGGIVNGVDVDEYAMEIHENYDDEHVGPGTEAKRRANPGRYIGRKFLERAFDSQKVKIVPGIFQAILKELPK